VSSACWSTYLEQVHERGPRVPHPVANPTGRGTVLGGPHHPLLLFTCAFLVRALALCRVFGRRDLLHGDKEIGSIGVGDGECERGVVRERGEGARGAREEFGGDIAGYGVLRGRRVEGAGVGEDERDESEFLHLVLGEQVCPAFLGLPLPRRLFADSQVLAASQQGLEVDSSSHHSRVSLEEALVQHAQVRVAGHECDCNDSVDRVRAGLLGDGEKNGGDMAVVPAGARLLRVASSLPAASEVSEHRGALKLIRRGSRVAVYGLVRMG
jgi:hypothetical protein